MSLDIIVCIKSVLLDAPDGRVIRLPETCALNPFDLPAIEMALRLRDENGGSVTALTMGPEVSSLALYEAMAMGVDRSVLISDSALAGSDTLATSTALGAAIMKLKTFDLLFFGTRTSDSDTGQVGPQTSVRLDLPLVTGVYNLEYRDKQVIVDRRMDEFVESYEVSLPAAFTIHPAAVQPRDSSLLGIEKAFGAGTFERMGLAELGISADEVGDMGSSTRVVSMSRIKRKRKCEFVTGSVEEQADELVRRLKEAGHIG
ncbi:electron transfer flavoprotein subunit beta/FixA family protein [Deltaproteobacteria bacterium]|nr:electron transfer flavoprotein subunit beta/FixA family protein [Deltaproteobacteria bacterium]